MRGRQCTVAKDGPQKPRLAVGDNGDMCFNHVTRLGRRVPILALVGQYWGVRADRPDHH
jgi:hypothetical protein